MDFRSRHKWRTVGLVVVGSVSASSSAREGLHARRECWCTYVDFEQGLVALNNVRSFLRLRNMFVYVAPDGHHVNSKSSFEL